MLTRPLSSLPVLPATLLSRWPAFDLNSENRRVSIWQYARGDDAPLQDVKDQLENHTFEPSHFDMLLIFNGLKSALRSDSVPHRVLASTTWALLYPRASPQDRAHLRLLLSPRIFRGPEAAPAEPFFRALSAAWEYGPDVALYCLLGLDMPSRVLALGLKGSTIEDALRMAVVPAWSLLKTPSSITTENALSQSVCYGLPPEEYPAWRSLESAIQVLGLPASPATPLWRLTSDHSALQEINIMAGYFMEQWNARPKEDLEVLSLPDMEHPV